MGINGLCIYLRKLSRDIEIDIPITSLSGHRVAIDASVYFYKYVSADNKCMGNWIDMFINLIVELRKNNIRPVFIFDGKAPIQKERTQKDRRVIRERTGNLIKELEDILELLEDVEFNDAFPSSLKHRMDIVLKQDVRYMSRKEILCKMNAEYNKQSSRAIHIGPGHYKKVQDVLTYMGLPWFKATGEAEKTCAWLNKWEYVKGVITTDSDVIAYGTPIFIKDIRFTESTFKIILHQDVLDLLEMSEPQLLDFCIMCGTDYNKRIKGKGTAKCYDLIQEYVDLDDIPAAVYDTETLYHEDVRSLFKLPEKNDVEAVIEGYSNDKEFKIPAIKNIARGELAMFLMKCNSRFTVLEIEQYVYQPKFIIT